MGARWPWRAWCAEGHEFSGFSGGSDGVCELVGCKALVVRERQEPFPDDPQGAPIPDPLVTRLQEQQQEINTLTARLAREGHVS